MKKSWFKYFGAPLAVIAVGYSIVLAFDAKDAASNETAPGKKPLWQQEDRWSSNLGEDVDPNEIANDPSISRNIPKGFVGESPSLTVARKAAVQILAFRTPGDFDYEFAMLLKDRKLVRAFVISTARAGKAPARGIHRLVTPIAAKRPYPWVRSAKYENSPMFWGQQAYGGYFIHSTPHYGQLGRPASMGCIRVSMPDAMEIFDHVANQNAGRPSYIMFFEGTTSTGTSEGSKLLREVLAENNMSVSDLKARLTISRDEVSQVSSGDIEMAGKAVEAHVRPGEPNVPFPLCRDKDCWSFFKADADGRQILPIAQLDTFHGKRAVSVKNGDAIVLNDLVDGAIGSLDATRLHDIRIQTRGDASGLMVKVCDPTVPRCSLARGSTANKTSISQFPMHQIANILKDSSQFVLQVQGSGEILQVLVRYKQ